MIKDALDIYKCLEKDILSQAPTIILMNKNLRNYYKNKAFSSLKI